jgi:hypothetical protein
LLPHFVTTSRLNILITLVTPLVVLRLFGFSIGKRMLGISFIVLIIFWFAVTILRGNAYTNWVSSSRTRFTLSEAIDDYSGRLSSTSTQLLYADRVGNIAFIAKNLNENPQYLYGQTLIAGLGNYVADFSMRLRGERLLESPFLLANQYITEWRFGNAYMIGWPVPPSVEGEFFMQGGYIALVILSYLLGCFLYWSRQKMASTKSLIVKWILIECLTKLGFYFAMGEVSSVYTYLIYVIVIMVVYASILFVINTKRRTKIYLVGQFPPQAA